MKTENAIAEAVMQCMNDGNLTKSMKQAKLDAYGELTKIIVMYREHGFVEELITVICEKKIDFIKNATTKSALSEIIKPSVPHYNGNEFVPQRPEYHIEQEEMILWSMASLKAPLNHIATQRYLELVKKYFPEVMRKM